MAPTLECLKQPVYTAALDKAWERFLAKRAHGLFSSREFCVICRLYLLAATSKPSSSTYRPRSPGTYEVGAWAFRGFWGNINPRLHAEVSPSRLIETLKALRSFKVAQKPPNSLVVMQESVNPLSSTVRPHRRYHVPGHRYLVALSETRTRWDHTSLLAKGHGVRRAGDQSLAIGPSLDQVTEYFPAYNFSSYYQASHESVGPWNLVDQVMAL